MAFPWKLAFYDVSLRGTTASPYLVAGLYKSPILLPVTRGTVKITRPQDTKNYNTLGGTTIAVRGPFSQPHFEFPDLFFSDMQEMEYFLNMVAISNKVLILYHPSVDPWDPPNSVSYPVVADKFPDIEMVDTPDQVTKPRYRVTGLKFVAVTNTNYSTGIEVL